jgi:hypothetical protein
MPWPHSRASIRFATAKVLEEGFRESMHSNNPLAVELESENDAACENFVSCPFRYSLPFALPF